MQKVDCSNIILSRNKLKLSYGRFSEIPDKLKQIPHWVCWKKVTSTDGGITKVPIDPQTLRYASTNDPETWADYEAANRSYLRNRGQIDGLGFVFTKGSSLIGIDLDKVRDPITGQLHPSLNAFLSRFPSYTEVSQSGRGCHIILKGELPEGWGNKAIIDGMTVEIYDDKRYFVMTGQGEKKSIEPITDQAIEYLRPYFEDRNLSTTSIENEIDDPGIITPAIEFGERLLIEAFLENAPAKAVRLFNGDTSDYNNDQSRCDLALCCYLAPYCDDIFDLDRLFRRSEFYRKKDAAHRQKWERPDYRIKTLSKAMQLAGI